MDYAIKTFLERLGLSKNEIKVYIAALETGEVTPTMLAKRAHIHRVAVYPLIESLAKRGLLSQSGSHHNRRIVAKHPQSIEAILRNERRRARRLQERFESVLPQLKAMHTQVGMHPRVQFFEGAQGLEQINADIIATLASCKPAQRITYSYSNPAIIDERFEDYIRGSGGYVDERVKNGIRNKVIARDCEATQEIARNAKRLLCEVAILSEKQFPFKNDITIYANKMAIQALGNELVGVIIESKEIVDDQRAIFNLAWAGAQHHQSHDTTDTNTT